MSAIVQPASCAIQPATIVPASTTSPAPVSRDLPTVSFTGDSDVTALANLRTAATTQGVARITDLPHTPPISAIQALFDRLATDPELAAELNATYPARGVYKNAALRTTERAVDQKLTVDLSRNRIGRIPDSLCAKLGAEFAQVLDFFDAIHAQLVPLLVSATSAVIGTELAPMHVQENVNYRMCDYPPQLAAKADAARCGAHRDYGTVTLVFQDGNGGLEYQTPAGDWVALSGSDVIVFWGWCAHVMSGGRVVPARHRVLTTEQGVRRNTAVMFVAPDVHVPLMPLVDQDAGVFGDRIRQGQVSVAEFKDEVGKKWRWREGNEDNPAHGGDQDLAILAMLRE